MVWGECNIVVLYSYFSGMGRVLHSCFVFLFQWYGESVTKLSCILISVVWGECNIVTLYSYFSGMGRV